MTLDRLAVELDEIAALMTDRKLAARLMRAAGALESQCDAILQLVYAAELLLPKPKADRIWTPEALKALEENTEEG